MKQEIKRVFKKYRKLFLTLYGIIFGLLVLAVVGYASRGIFRSIALPAYTKTFRTGKLRHIADSEYQSLDKPFATLTGQDSKITTSCNLDIAERLHASISCSAKASATVSTLSEDKQRNFKLNAEAIEQLLRDRGWTPAFEDVGITNTNPEIWKNSPNGKTIAVYSKVVGDVYCQLVFFYQYGEKRLLLDYWCSDTFRYFADGWSYNPR